MFQREKPVEHEIFIMEKLKQAFNEDMSIQRINLIPLGVLEGKTLIECSAGGPQISVSLDKKGFSCFWIPVLELNLTTNCQADAEGITFPVFSPDFPVFELRWHPPIGMNLFLVVLIGDYNIESGIYLVAIDNDHRKWRLPLSNLYDDCKLCNGSYERVTHQPLLAVRAAWDQFNLSRWNGDLYAGRATENTMSNTRSLFAFKASNDGFEQVPVVNWETLCQKISNPLLTKHYPFIV